MTSAPQIELAQLAAQVGLPLEKTGPALELLDEGNTIAFITRYRRDQTGGLDEEQIRQIQVAALRMRQLVERKEAIRKSIEAQGKLTPELLQAIDRASSVRVLEDLYLPYKPRKQTLATVARERGLEPLAHEIWHADSAVVDRPARAAEFVDPERGVVDAADALDGASHLLAERFADDGRLRARLRRLLRESGTLVSARVDASSRPAETGPPDQPNAAAKSAGSPSEGAPNDSQPSDSQPSDSQPSDSQPSDSQPSDSQPSDSQASDSQASDSQASDSQASDSPPADSPPADSQQPPPPANTDSPIERTGGKATALPAPAASDSRRGSQARPAVTKSQKRKQRKNDRLEAAFRDYFDYRESLTRVPPHRVLAINRGEKAKILRVRIEADPQQIFAEAERRWIDPQHPHVDLLRSCLRAALDRFILPSLERELRRELAEKAEEHAVRVFARNLRKLLLQPPVRGRRVLAIDPGFRSGAKLAALDAFGNVVCHELISIVGSEAVKKEGRLKLVELLRTHEISLVAIGNGTACRETEQLVASVIGDELQEQEIAYVIVNEAGASVYSTSPLGREELPDFDPVVRSAISIGRRLLDPLSELVKIAPANLGVGMYQHDIKTKHLRDSLDSVVESGVNFVGVDLNTASPALLSYVSGLNQLTARRVYEHRCQHGPFVSRQQLLDVPGIGEATYVQAAGFLKIADGENPLDATWIHPESYPVAVRLLERLGSSVDELAERLKGAPAKGGPSQLAARVAEVDLGVLAEDEGVGELLLADLVAALTRPGRDPRDDLSPPMFRTGILKLEDLKPGMELVGTVLNVVDFGAFVDIGISDSALIHISRLANRFVKDPHEIVSLGDTVHVWVTEVDKARRRVSLTAVPPGTPSSRPAGEASRKPKTRRPPSRKKRTVGKAAGKVRPPKYQKKRPPSKPITEGMAEGTEPMSSFSDLLQFYQQQKPESDEPRSGPSS